MTAVVCESELAFEGSATAPVGSSHTAAAGIIGRCEKRSLDANVRGASVVGVSQRESSSAPRFEQGLYYADGARTSQIFRVKELSGQTALARLCESHHIPLSASGSVVEAIEGVLTAKDLLEQPQLRWEIGLLLGNVVCSMGRGCSWRIGDDGRALIELSDAVDWDPLRFAMHYECGSHPSLMDSLNHVIEMIDGSPQ